MIFIFSYCWLSKITKNSTKNDDHHDNNIEPLILENNDDDRKQNSAYEQSSHDDEQQSMIKTDDALLYLIPLKQEKSLVPLHRLIDKDSFDDYSELESSHTCPEIIEEDKEPNYNIYTTKQLKIYTNRPHLGKGQFGKVFEGKLNSGNKQIKDRPF